MFFVTLISTIQITIPSSIKFLNLPNKMPRFGLPWDSVTVTTQIFMENPDIPTKTWLLWHYCYGGRDDDGIGDD